MKQFTSIEKIDTGILYVLEFTFSVSSSGKKEHDMVE